jgi:hypothetical protein
MLSKIGRGEGGAKEFQAKINVKYKVEVPYKMMYAG